MSTENDDTAALPTGGQPGDRPGDQPTAPIRRPARARTDDPTLVFETFGAQSGDRQQPAAHETVAATRAIPHDAATPSDSTPPASTPPDTPPPPAPGSGSTAVPAAPDDLERDRDPRPSLRVGTVVWGLIIAIIGAGLVAIASGARFDLELASIGLLALAGIGLVVGSIVTGARHRR